MKNLEFFVLCFFLLFVLPVFSQEDEPGCKDHPLLTRMPNFYIYSCSDKDYDKVPFMDERGEMIEVEGKVYRASYWLKEDAKAPSGFQIRKNYENAIKKIGGKVSIEYVNQLYLTLAKDNLFFWIIINAANEGDNYELTVVEKKKMAQEVVADAKSFLSDLKSTGHTSVYGIYFDTDKADIKPESEKAISEIAKLLKENPDLKVYIVGHTDNRGTLEHNLKLSKERADNVLKELVEKYNIPQNRLSAQGLGPLSPVSSNKMEEGRAKNRRVEIVEQ
ncbi:MAG: OmpA family protein [Thermoanaerobaculia bacterium]